MNRILLSLFSLVFVCGPEVASAQYIEYDFPEEMLHEDFSNNSRQWEQNSNLEKFYIMSNGQYIVHRLSAEQPDFLYLPGLAAADHFDFLVELRFDKHNNREQSAGLAFMSDEASKSMLLLEVNELRQYRLSRSVNGQREYLSGENGRYWEKSALLKGAKSNLLEIKSDSGRYDVYFNQQYAFSFQDDQLKAGKLALYVGANSKVIFEQLSVLRKKAVTAIKTPGNIKPIAADSSAAPSPGPSDLEMLRKELEELKRKLEDCTRKQTGG